MRYIISIFCTVLLFSATLVASSPRVGVAFWDVDRLYDTLPSPFYDDDAFTPEGRMRWSGERYRHKVERVAAVIDSMAMPIVMLYGVESRDVVCDIVKASSLDYTFLHSTRNSLDGLDFALLYYGDVFYVDRVTQRRDMIIVEGEVMGETITLVATLAGRYLDEVEGYSHDARVVIMGHYLPETLNSLLLEDCFTHIEKRGYGNSREGRGWTMHHRAAVGSEIEVISRGVYLKEWLLSEGKQAPLPTYDNKIYMAGYSNYLPIFLYFR